MSILDIRQLPVIEKLLGWRGRLFHSPSLTFGHWDFSANSSIHAHYHPQEEVWEILEGELEITIDGAVEVAGPGMVAIVPANVTHSVRALSDGRAIVVDYPLRTDF
jgi:quercetin dioxygenase-like cupin family protein